MATRLDAAPHPRKAVAMKRMIEVLLGLSLVVAMSGCTPTTSPSRSGAHPVTEPEPHTPTSIPPAQALPENVPPMPQEAPSATTPCGAKECAKGTECVEYYGIAGKAGGTLYSCEVRCKTNAECPASAPTCKTIADGPGQVCRS